MEKADYDTKCRVIGTLVEEVVVREDRLAVTCHLPDDFVGGGKASAVALRHDRRVDCDAKRHVRFEVKPLPRPALSDIRREANLRHGLKRNLFHADGRLKARLGGKPKGDYTLDLHTQRITCPVARGRFLQVRELILRAGDFEESVRKRHIAYVDSARYNRFQLLPQRRSFWLAIKGRNLRVEGLHRGRCDGIQTFFRIGNDILLNRVRDAIREHARQPIPPIPVAAQDATSFRGAA